MPSIEELGAPKLVDREKLRREDELESLLLLVRPRTAVDESAQAKCVVAVWRATPCREVGTRPFCIKTIDIVTGSASVGLPCLSSRSSEVLLCNGPKSRRF